MGQVTYLSVALAQVIAAGLTSEFVFRNKDYIDGPTSSLGFYNQYDVADIGANFWQYASMLKTYSTLAIFAVAFITQILAMVGVASSINTMVWSYGVFLGMTSINMIYLTLMGYAYDTAVMKYRTDLTVAAMNARDQMKRDFVQFFGWTAAVSIALYIDFSKWDQGEKMATVAKSEEGAEEAALFGTFHF